MDNDNRSEQARLPRWFKIMAMEVGRRRRPKESVAQVLVRLAEGRLRKEHAALPELGAKARR